MSADRAEHIKAIPGDDGFLRIEMDEAGFAMFERLLSRAVASPKDSPQTFAAIRDRISGAMLAGAVVMNWRKLK